LILGFYPASAGAEGGSRQETFLSVLALAVNREIPNVALTSLVFPRRERICLSSTRTLALNLATILPNELLALFNCATEIFLHTVCTDELKRCDN